MMKNFFIDLSLKGYFKPEFCSYISCTNKAKKIYVVGRYKEFLLTITVCEEHEKLLETMKNMIKEVKNDG